MTRDGSVQNSPALRKSAVSVPGKIILMGEHAAVYGRPALVAAIDLRLGVSLSQRREGAVRFSLPQLGYEGEAGWEAILEQARRCREAWLECAEEGRSFERVFAECEGPQTLAQLALGEAVRACGVPPAGGLDLAVESALPLGSGLGSSAALAVGVAGAWLDLVRGAADREAVERIALEVERRQHGTPSGVDSAAVLQGGVLWVEPGPGGARPDPVSPHSDLLQRFSVFHTGPRAEPTGTLVAAVRRRLRQAKRTVRSALDRIQDATKELRRQLLSDREEPLTVRDLVRACEAALEDLGIVPRAIAERIRSIEKLGFAAKISGAGALAGESCGCILVYSPDPERPPALDLLERWRPLPVRLGAEGLRKEPLE